MNWTELNCYPLYRMIAKRPVATPQIIVMDCFNIELFFAPVQQTLCAPHALIHVGLVQSFHSPPNTDIDYRNFNVRLYDIFACVYSRGTSDYCPIRTSFVEQVFTELGSEKFHGVRKAPLVFCTQRSPIHVLTKLDCASELCESRGVCPGFPVPNSPYGLCGRKAILK